MPKNASRPRPMKKLIWTTKPCPVTIGQRITRNPVRHIFTPAPVIASSHGMIRALTDLRGVYTFGQIVGIPFHNPQTAALLFGAGPLVSQGLRCAESGYEEDLDLHVELTCAVLACILRDVGRDLLRGDLIIVMQIG